MVEDLGWEDLPLTRKSVIPGRGFFLPTAEVPTVDRTSLDEADVIVLADPDADGLTAAALVRSVHDAVAIVPTEPGELDTVLSWVAESVDEVSRIYLLDLCPDRFEPIDASLASLVSKSEQVVWFDHHQWDPTVRAGVEETGVALTVGESDEVATADVALDQLVGSFDDRWVELAEVVRDHDLWLREDPRSDDIADFAYWSTPEEFVDTVASHGADLPETVQTMLEERREEKQALIDLAVSRAEYRELGDVTLGVTYGRCSQNEVAEALREAGADAAVVIKPSGGISLRGTEAFQRCHEIARRVGGGGHPKAAGCKPEIYDDILDYAYHWATHGTTAKHVMLEAFRQVVEASE